MAKRPSFQFYVKDFVSDRNVQAMTNEEVGVYIKLLCFMWEDENCCLPDDKDYLAKISHSNNSVITNLYHTFKLVNGVLRHKRLDVERNRQDQHRLKRSEGGQKGMASRWKKAKQSQKNKIAITQDNLATAIASSNIKEIKENTDFESFWKAYPRHEARKKAEEAFVKVGVGIDVLLSAIESQKKTAKWQDQDGKFIPYPATWLNGLRWLDEISPHNSARTPLPIPVIIAKPLYE